MRYTVSIDVGVPFTDCMPDDRPARQVLARKQLAVPGGPTTGLLSGLDGHAATRAPEA